MGLLKVDDQLERRPVAILQTAHLMRSFRRNPLGGVQIPLLPLQFTNMSNLDAMMPFDQS